MWNNIFQAPKEKTCQQQILCPAEIFLNIKEEIKTFSDEEKLRKFIASKPTLKELCKEVFYTERK